MTQVKEDGVEAVQEEMPPPAAMMGLITGYWVSQERTEEQVEHLLKAARFCR